MSVRPSARDRVDALAAWFAWSRAQTVRWLLDLGLKQAEASPQLRPLAGSLASSEPVFGSVGTARLGAGVLSPAQIRDLDPPEAPMDEPA